MGKQNKPIEFDIVNGREYIWKTPTKIETLDTPAEVCPHCSAPIVTSFSLVSVGNNNKAKVPGSECRNCGILFVKRSKAIRNLLQDNEHAKEMTLNGESVWNYSYQRQKEERKKKRLKTLHEKLDVLSQVDGGLMLIALKGDNEQIDCVITNIKEPQCIQGVIVTHYSSLLARELLTSVYQSSRTIKLNDKAYKIVRPYYPSNSKGEKQVFPMELKPSEMRIKVGGGYSSSIKNNLSEIVDVLLFSPFTQRYEMARATLDHADGECYMDIGIFRSFVKEYGNPGLQLSFEESSSFGLSFDELRAESILHAYGYSVSESDALTEAERLELLTEIVDLELLTIPYIVRLLDFFIRTHTSDKYYNARDKWKRDMKYISDYKINTQRFLIVK